MQSRAGERGATLLDVVVGSALMTMVFVGIVGAFRLSVEAVSNNKARAGAIALANERLEYIRSLQYGDVGTVGGIPAGLLDQVATSSINGVLYTRRTFVSYEDDPYDGVGAADSNGVTADFKAAKVTLTWQTKQGSRSIAMVTRLSPPSVEVAIPGGTIVVHAVDATFQPVANAEVRLFNNSVSPAVDLTTYTDTTGTATILGAPAGAGYALTVTKGGYSVAQTYGASASNTNPIPAHIGVALYQTTAATFEIDLTADLSIEIYAVPEEDTWADSFLDTQFVATTTNTEVVGGEVLLEDEGGSFAAAGEIISNPISIVYLDSWNELSWGDSVPANTSLTYHLYDASMNLIPESDLPGNTQGFTASPVSLTSLSTSTYSLIRVGAEFESSDPAETPRMFFWSVGYTEGAQPLPNIGVALHGAKVIGTAANGSQIYKYTRVHTANGSGKIALPNIEWDLYTLSVPSTSGYDIASSCTPQPIGLLPNGEVTSRLYLIEHTVNSLLIDVRAADGTLIEDATVRLTRAGIDLSTSTDACGQVYIGSLLTGTVGGGNAYTISVEKNGYTTFTSTEVNVSGTSRLSVILN